ncbi:MAG: protein kinase [Candidatus Acidiferrales bacterium]
MSDDVTGARKGDYIILGTLGAGGMGKVYKVRNSLSDRVEAMKVLLPDLSDQKDLADRFLREIKVLASLHHPNIAELRTALTIDNQLIMIMEYVDGVTLAARLHQGPVRYADTVAYFDQALSALSYAHAQKIVHRDIKPANMMLTPQGVVKLMDFGIARSGNDMGLTMTHTTLGSIAYMSPEQVKCQPIDARSDLYSVGVSLYEMVTGQRPHISDNNFEVMQAHLQVPPTPPIDIKPDIPLALSQLILMAMAKDPAQRFQTADALRSALQSVAPSLGEPSQIAPITSQIPPPFGTPPTPLPVSPAAPRSVTPQPVTARPVSAQPITARPVTTPPLPQTVRMTGAVTPAPVSAAVHRGLYITLGALLVVAVLVAAGFAVPRWMRTHAHDDGSFFSSKVSTPAPTAADASAAPKPVDAPSSPPGAEVIASVEPGSDPAASQPATKPAAKRAVETSKPPAIAPAKSQVPAPSDVQTPPASPDASKRPAAPQDAKAAEESKRAIAASAAELAAVEHEELDELSARANKVNAKVDALQKQQLAQGSLVRGDLASTQQRLQNDLSQAQTALQNADVQNAQKFMDQADAEISKLEKSLLDH